MSPALESHSIDDGPQKGAIASSPESVEVSLKQVQEVCIECIPTRDGMKRGYVLYVSARLCFHISACLPKHWELRYCR